MPRASTNKLYRTFVKGLITEAGFLTYPEDASTDELNTVLHRRGNRPRRFGMDFEPDSVQSLIEGYDDSAVVTEFFWKAVADKSTLNFLAVQVGDKLHFYDASISPLGSGKKDFTVNLLEYKAPTATVDQVRGQHVQMSAGKGFLFIAQEYMDPLVIEYDIEADNVSVVRVVIQVRDFDGVNDSLANDEEPSELSKEHHYNLKNQGWVSPGTSSTQGTGGGTTTPEVIHYDPWTGEERRYSKYELEQPAEA